jgi:ketopantoate reductase
MTIDEIWVRTEKAGPYKSSTVLDLVSGAPLEMRYLFGVPLERAR